MVAQYEDISGQRFGRLTALDPTDRRTGEGGVIWRCLCDCGNECEVSARLMKKGNTLSCGCGEYETRVANVTSYAARAHVDGTNLATVGSDKPYKNNTTGIKGVTRKRNGKYLARITLKGVTYTLGTFDTLREAAEARREAEIDMFAPIREAHGLPQSADADYQERLKAAIERERKDTAK